MLTLDAVDSSPIRHLISMLDDSRKTTTTKAQHGLEKKLLTKLHAFLEASEGERLEILTLKREAHVAYLYGHLQPPLPEPFVSLEASQTWILYWIVHALTLLKAPLPQPTTETDIVRFLQRCQDPHGGFGGGPQQLPHLAATYAAVMTLIAIGTPEAFDLIDRPGLEGFLLRMCVAPEKGGGLTVHADGEVDIRGCYTAMAVAHVLGLDKAKIAEASGMVSFIQQCQSFEGGLGGEPGNEAHGGYTFCGVAALVLLNRLDAINLGALMKWAVHMQGSMEGGFKGRTHKLVDGCYSYWQGSLFSLLQDITLQNWSGLKSIPEGEIDFLEDLPMYEGSLEEFSARGVAKELGEKKLRMRAEELELNLEDALKYLMSAPSPELPYDQRIRLDLFKATFEECQGILQATDVSFAECFPPGSAARQALPQHRCRDAVSEPLFDALGLQFWVLVQCQGDEGGLRDKPNKEPDLYHTCYCLSGLAAAQQCSGVVLGVAENTLCEVDPVLNLAPDKRDAALEYFKRLE